MDGTTIANHMDGEASAGYLELVSCNTMYTDGLARPLREAGVDVISGYSQPVSFQGAYEFENHFVEALLQGKTVGEAALFTKQKMRESIFNWIVKWDGFEAQHEELLAADSVSFDPHSTCSLCESMAKERGAAFLIFVSEQDPYPGENHKDESQTVKSTWKLPLGGDASGDISVSVKAGSSFLAFFDGVRRLLDLLEGSVPPGIGSEMIKVGDKYRPCLTGTPTKPGYYEAKFRVGLDGGKFGTRWARILVIGDEVSKTEQSEIAAAGTDQTIALSYGGGKIYSVEQVQGEVPPGLAFLWDADGGGPRYCGAPTRPGTYRAVFRFLLTDGTYAEHTISVLVPSRIAESAESFSLRKEAETQVPLGVAEPGSVLQVSLLEGRLPPGMDWKSSMSEPLYITGTPTAAGTWTAAFRILTANGTLLTHRVTVRVYGEAPYLEEYAVDLSGGPFTVSLEDHNTWLDLTLALASQYGQINLKVNTSSATAGLDLDRDGTWDVSVTRGIGSVVFRLLDDNSLTGDDFILKLNQSARDAADQKYDTDHSKKYARSVRFHLIERYDLTIAGTQVTSRNRTDVLGDGAFAFDGVKTLTVLGDHFTIKKQPVIRSGLKGLVIRTDGLAEINSPGPCIQASSDLTVAGSGQLILTSGGSAAVELTDGAKLEVYNTDLEVTNTGAGSGLAGSGTGEKLSLDHCGLVIDAPGGAALGFNGGLWLSRCLAAEPKHAIAGKPEIRDAEGNPATSLTVTPYETKYNLEINGVTVTNRNMKDILADGTFTYDVYGTLTVNGDYTQPADVLDPVIRTTGGGPIIRIMEDVTIEARGPCLDLASNATIRSFDSTLTLRSTDGSAVTVSNGAKLTLDHSTVRAEGAKYGLTGSDGGEWLFIEESALSARGGSAAVSGFSKGVSTNGLVSLEKPAGGSFAGGTVLDSGGIAAKEAVFRHYKTFDLRIDGYLVTELNMDDILGKESPGNGDGVFSFDGDHTLTVSGDFTSDYNIIENGIVGLVIRAEKDSTLRTGTDDEWSMPMGDPIFTGVDLTVTGPGKLTLISGNTAGINTGYQCRLTLEDVELTSRGPCGLWGGSQDESLTVRNSSVTLKSDGSAIEGFRGGVTFDGCVLTEPAGAEMKDGYLADTEGNKIRDAVIVPETVSVTGTDLTYKIFLPGSGSARLAAAWYDGDGKQLGCTVKDVPRGGMTEGSIDVEKDQMEYRLFALDSAAWAPLRPAWSSIE